MAILYKDIPAFDPISREFIVPTLHDRWLLKEGIADENFIENLRFRESDVKEFEFKHFSDHKGMEVEPIADDRENVYRKTLIKIIDSATYRACEHCLVKHYAKKNVA